MNIFSKLAITAGMSLLLAAGVAQAQSKTFNIWWFELPDTPQSKAWTKALDELKAKHPDVTVNFELKTFEQLQKAGSLILNSDQAPDVLEYNKGNATTCWCPTPAIFTTSRVQLSPSPGRTRITPTVPLHWTAIGA